jgi:hypothetical protein
MAFALGAMLMFSCSDQSDTAETTLPDSEIQSVTMTMPAGADVISFNSKTSGTIVSEMYGDNGMGPVKLYGMNPKSPSKNAAMIFNSAVPTGQDADLGTPHTDFGGPGVGVGGSKGSLYENNTAMGNSLIITEDWDSSDPDDADLVGATFTFDFSALKNVTVYSMNMMDVEKIEPAAKVDFYNSSGEKMGGSHSMPQMGDNGIYMALFGGSSGVSGVAKMVVTMNGSGSIDNIVFKTESPTTPPPPSSGCTYTMGYWKTHTKYDKKPDATWSKIGDKGEDSKFFLSGQTYIQVLRTPTKGNAYYILAHQYIAAKLNMLKGASAPLDVMEAMVKSEDAFGKYTPNQVKAMSSSSQMRMDMIKWAETLDKYNNGMTGPGHCN